MKTMNWTAWAVEKAEGEGRDAHLLVTAETSGDEPRAPVMVNMVLDRSGSMKGAMISASRLPMTRRMLRPRKAHSPSSIESWPPPAPPIGIQLPPMAYLLFVMEIVLMLSREPNEDSISNILFTMAMYFTYCQFWIYIVGKAIYLDLIKKEKRTWVKTVRFDVEPDSGKAVDPSPQPPTLRSQDRG